MSSEEFGFCELPDAWSSGSSIMPQKKNPDAAELLRAKAPRIVGHLSAMHGVMHALPLTYNKDMQEDKEHLFDAADTLELCLSAAAGMLEGVRFERERLRQAASDEMIAATDIADLLVRRGMPFRQAHGVVAALVRTALESARPLSQLTPQELADHSEAFSARAPSSTTRCSRRAHGSSRRSPRAGLRCRACGSSSRLPGTCLMPSARAEPGPRHGERGCRAPFMSGRWLVSHAS